MKNYNVYSVLDGSCQVMCFPSKEMLENYRKVVFKNFGEILMIEEIE